MKEYIERDAITRAFRETDPDLFTEYDEHYEVESGYSHEAVESIIAGLPAADVVEVVRCGECRHAEDSLVLWCNEHEQAVSKLDFCSHGARMDKEDEHDKHTSDPV